MLDTPSAQVPALSLNDEAGDPAAFAAALGGSFERFGFAVVSDHGIPRDLIDRAWAETKKLFELPEAEKRAYHTPGGGGARGYTPFKTEIAKGASQVDLKEFWHVGRELPEGHRFAAQMSPNIWPTEPAGFKPVFLELFEAFDRAGDRLLSAIARHLGLAPNWFDAEEAGLELLGSDGKWLAIRPPEGAMVVNVGDMLQRLTNHVLPSTTHRVVNPPPERRGVSRYSMPFFLHPAPDFLIETLPGCIDADHPNRYPTPITAHDYLHERLVEIGLVKK